MKPQGNNRTLEYTIRTEFTRNIKWNVNCIKLPQWLEIRCEKRDDASGSAEVGTYFRLNEREALSWIRLIILQHSKCGNGYVHSGYCEMYSSFVIAYDGILRSYAGYVSNCKLWEASLKINKTFISIRPGTAAVDELKNKHIIIIIINKNNTNNNYSKSLVLVTQLNLFRQLTFCHFMATDVSYYNITNNELCKVEQNSFSCCVTYVWIICTASLMSVMSTVRGRSFDSPKQASFPLT